MTDVALFNLIDRMLWGVAIAVLIICGLFFWYRAYLMEQKREKRLMLGFGALFMGFALTRIFFYLSDLTIKGDYTNHIFYGDISNVYQPIHSILSKMGYISAFSSYLVFFIAFEYVLKKSKFILTFVTSLLVLIIAILPFSISKSVTYISSLVFTVILIVVMLFLTKKSHPDFQIVPLAILIGTLIIFIGHMLDASMIRILELVPTVIPPILYIIGCIIFISPTFYDPIKGSKEYLYWILFYTFYLFIIGISIYSTIVEASLNNALLNLSYTIFWIIIIFVGFVSVFLLNRKFNYQVRLREGKVQMIKEKDPLSLFTKKEKNELNKIAELQHIYVILKSGITIYSQPLLGELDESQEEKDKEDESKDEKD